jgi:hypothetical protein
VARLAFTNLNGVTLSLSSGAGGSHTIVGSHNALTSQSNQALSAGNGSFTFQTATFADSNGVSFSTGTQGIYASHNALTSQSNQALSGSNGSFAFQTATFGNLNGLSFYTSNGSFVGSYTVPTVTNSSWTASDNATSATVARLAFTNQNGVTLSLSTGAGGSHTIVGSHNGITSQTNQTGGIYAVGNTTGQSSSSTYDARTLSIDGAGMISVGWSNSTLRVSATQSNQTLGNYAIGNTTGQSSSSTFDARTVSFSGAGNISVGYSGNAIVLSGGTAAASPVNFSAGTTSNNLGSVVFSNTNNMSFGLNGSTITASVNAINIGVSTGGNTLGTTGTVEGGGGQYLFVGTGGITLSQSTNGASSGTVTIMGADSVTYSRYPIGPWGWSTAASTLYSGSTSANGASTHSTMSYYIQPYPVNVPITVSKIRGIFSVNTGAAGTGTATVRNYFGIYTKNVDTFSLISSFIAGIHYTQSSATSIQVSYWTGSGSNSIISVGSVNSTAAMTGPKLMPFYQAGGGFSLPANQYFIVVGMHSLSAGANPLAISHGVQGNTYNNEFGNATSSTGPWDQWMGAFSSTSSTNAADSNQWLMPSTINTSAITCSAAAHDRRMPIMFLA